jgi:hypothetical protein
MRKLLGGVGRRIMDRLRPQPRPAMFALDPAEAPALAARANGVLPQLFFTHRGRAMRKKVHYLDIYDRYFSRYRGRATTVLEIGVCEGGSLELWRKYFGPDATIFGIDVNPACTARADLPNQVRIGAQADAAFLRSVVEEMGPPDIVIDDGSHVGADQRASFATLFPLLAAGGLYVIEDVNTAYWRAYRGGYGTRGTAVDLAGALIDDLHGAYHDRPAATAARDWIGALHVYDALIVVEKERAVRPATLSVGG